MSLINWTDFDWFIHVLDKLVLKFYLSADDIFIYLDSNDLFILQKVVNRELKKVKKWLDANRLSFNIPKTNFVIFHSKPKNLKEVIRIKFGSKLLTINYYWILA